MSSELEPQLREDSPLYHDALRISIKTPSFYRHDVFLVDEDDDVEFKGHLAFSYEQLPVKAKRLQTKRHISSVANGMLNNEKGGIILMGVHDDKRIEGFTLSRAQQQHIVLSIVDTFNRFTPPVPKHFYDISFIEIIDGKEPKDPLMKTLQLPPVNLQHQLRTEDPCWCDRQIRDLRNFFTDFQGRRWIVELTIKKRNLSDKRTSRFLQSATWGDPEHKLFTTETGKGYYRLKDVTKRIAWKDIENFNKVVETLIKKNPVYELLDTRIPAQNHIYWSNSMSFLGFCTEDRRKRKSSTFCFSANIETTNIFVATSTPERSSRYLKPKVKKKIWIGKFSFLQSEEKEKKKNRQQSTWSLPSEKWISLEKHFGWRMSFLQRLLLQRDSTTTEKLQNGLVNEEVCKIVEAHKWIVNIFCFDVSSNVLKSYVEDMKNFVTRHLYSKKEEEIFQEVLIIRP